MNHWDPVERIVKERHDDLDREATHLAIARAARARGLGSPARPTALRLWLTRLLEAVTAGRVPVGRAATGASTHPTRADLEPRRR